jgi:hypothetical protein
MFQDIITAVVVAFVIAICILSLYRIFTGKRGTSCSSCCGAGACCMKTGGVETVRKKSGNKPQE